MARKKTKTIRLTSKQALLVVALLIVVGVARYFSARSDLSRRSALRFTKANSAAE